MKIKDLFPIEKSENINPLRSFIIESFNETQIAEVDTILYEYLDKNKDKLLALDTYTEGDPVVASDSIKPIETKHGQVINKGEQSGELNVDFEDSEYNKPDHHPTRKDAVANESCDDKLQEKNCLALADDSTLTKVKIKKWKDVEESVSKRISKRVLAVFPENACSPESKELHEEKEMTPEQLKKREEIVIALKKNHHELQKRYGVRWEAVMYAIATKKALEESLSEMADNIIFNEKTDDGSIQIHKSESGYTVYKNDKHGDPVYSKEFKTIKEAESVVMQMLNE